MGGGFGDILDQSLAERVKHNTDQSTLSFFRSPRKGERNRRSRSFTRWVAAPLGDEASNDAVRGVADMVVDELLSTMSTIMRDLLVDEPLLLPEPPTWSDGAPLYATTDPRTSKGRFMVAGGNCMVSTGDHTRDLKRAYARLAMLNVRRPFEHGEKFRVYCSLEQAPLLDGIRKTLRFSYEVFPQRSLKAADPWVLTRAKPVASVRISKPAMETPDYDGVIYGTSYEVWLDDPTNTVRMRQAS